jgi:hypothetical protein
MEEVEVEVYCIGSGKYVGTTGFKINPTPKKKRRLNSFGEDVHLFPDGSVKRDEDSIIAAQRIWRERAYAPGTGVMYLKAFERFNAAVNLDLGQSETHTKPSEPCAS